MGMGRHEATFMNHLVKSKRIEHNIFSMCFGREGGHMVLGGVDQSHHLAPIKYTPLLDYPRGWFPVTVIDIRLNNESVGATLDDYNRFVVAG